MPDNNTSSKGSPTQRLKNWKNSQVTRTKIDFFGKTNAKLKIVESNPQLTQKIDPNQFQNNKSKIEQKEYKKSTKLSFWERLLPSQRILIFGVSTIIITALIVLSWFFLFGRNNQLQNPGNSVISNYNGLATAFTNPQLRSKTPITQNNTILTTDYGLFAIIKYLKSTPEGEKIDLQYISSSDSINEGFESTVLQSNLIVYTDADSSSWIENYLAGRNYTGKTLEIGSNLNKVSQSYNFGEDYTSLVDQDVSEFDPQPIDYNYQLNFENINLSSDKLVISLSQAFPQLRNSATTRSSELNQKISQLKNSYTNLNSCKNKTILTLGNNLSYLADQFSYQYIPFGYAVPDNLKPEETQNIIKIILENKLRYIFVSKVLSKETILNLQEKLGVNVLRLSALQSIDSESDIVEVLEWNLEQFRVAFGC